MKNLNEFSPTKQSWQVAEVKISYHSQSKVSDYPKINNPKDADLILRNNWSDDIELLEEFNALFSYNSIIIKAQKVMIADGYNELAVWEANKYFEDYLAR